MSLTAYQTAVKRLLQNPQAPTTLYATSDLTDYINTARGQVAGDGECIRFLGSLTTTIGLNNYPFNAINVGTPSVSGITGVLTIRAMRYATGTLSKWITPRPWDWFQEVNLNNPTSVNGPPAAWAQYAQGAQNTGTNSSALVQSVGGGSFFIDPPPDSTYGLILDCVCFPIALVDDTTVEAIPYLWTDAVPFLAAYYALLSSQMQARRADAEAYYNYYNTYVQKMLKLSQPAVNRYSYEQSMSQNLISSTGQRPQQ